MTAVSALTAFELALLLEIGRRHRDADGLRRQIETAEVLRRENSGAGFFVDLQVDRSLDPVSGPRVTGQVAVSIDGLPGPLLAMLFLQDGYVSMLEGAATEGSTASIDFNTCNFSILAT